jgi:hypothetical protein
MLIHNADITGSLTINNVPYNSGSFSGSFRGDGSQLTGIDTDPFPYTGSAIVSGSLNVIGDLLQNGLPIETDPFPYTGSAIISGSLNVIGDLLQNGAAIETDPFPYTGSAIISGSLVVTGSLNVSGGVTGSFTGSFVGNGSGLTGVTNATTASYIELSNVDGSASLSTRLTGLESFSSSLDTIYATDAELNAATASLSSSLGSSISANSASISSLQVASSSFSTRVTSLESFSSSLDTIYATDAQLNAATASLSSSLGSSISANSASISSLQVASGSFSTRVTSLESFSSSLDSIYATDAQLNAATSSLSSSLASNIALKLNISETASFAKTSINNSFVGTQQFVNITATGTASFGYIESVTGSAKIIGDAFIILNNDTPAERYAGIIVVDSGSINTTASLQFDGQTNDWFYEYNSASIVDHAVVLFGPEYSTIGNPTYLTDNRIPKATDRHHLIDSNISDNGTTISLGSNTQVTGSLNVSGGITGSFNGALSGNASTATTLQTARNIGGVSFNGSANIDLPGVNTSGNQNTSGNAASATVLQTARTIGGVSFNGSANIDLPGVNTSGTQNTSGNAASATVLQTARTIGGVSFNGSANINLPGVNTAGNQDTSGNASTATSAATLTTTRTLWGQNFNGSGNVTGALSSVTTLSMNNQLTNTLATGTAPFAITSTTRVANLNVATAGTADTLTTARNIGGVSFNGSANIDLPGVNTSGNQNTSGNAATATSAATWTTGRTITIGGTGKSVNGSANVSWSLAEIGAQATLTNPVTGTGTSGQVAYFTGTSAISSESNLFWDATNDRLGIGTNSPQKSLEVISGANDFASVGVQGLGVGQWTGIHFGYREANTIYRKSAIVFQRTDLTANNAQGKVHILNGPQGDACSATLADARLTIAENGNVGINSTSPSSRLSVCSTTACSTVVNVQGCAGQLFSVTDNLVGDIFSVSDISGIPILNVNSNGTVCVDSKIAVGANHTVSGAYASVTGGRSNTASGYIATIGGGQCNTASATYYNSKAGTYAGHATIAGGKCNTVSGLYSAIGGGRDHNVAGNGATIAGGVFNRACGGCSSILGGYDNQANQSEATIGGGGGNTASGYSATVSGGNGNNAAGNYSAIGGGIRNTACGFSSVVAGGCNNFAACNFNFIGGGVFNNASLFYNTVGGGIGNSAYGNRSSILGGEYNTTFCYAAAIGGGTCQTNSANYEFRVQALSKASGTFRIDHPDPSKTCTHYLSHSFVESPTAGDNIYRYKVNVINGTAVINLPSYYKYLNENDQIWVTPQGHFGIGYGEINIEQTQLTIYSNADGEYNVLLIGTRKDTDARNSWSGVETYK